MKRKIEFYLKQTGEITYNRKRCGDEFENCYFCSTIKDKCLLFDKELKWITENSRIEFIRCIDCLKVKKIKEPK